MTGFSTRAIRASTRAPRLDQQPTSVPIYQTATFTSNDAEGLADVVSDARAWFDMDIAAEPRGPTHVRLNAHSPPAGLAPRAEVLHEFGEGAMHVGHLDGGNAQRHKAIWNDNGAGLAACEPRGAFGGIKKGDLAAAGGLERGRAGDR